ncbi:MAG: hypothetical protein QXG00_04830 [Candidatus Woesearchaeota archaeon]
MEIKDFEEKFIYKIKIKIDENDYILLREPTVLEMKDFSATDEEKNINILRDLFPKCIIDHTFTKNGEKLNIDELIKVLKQSGLLYNEIIGSWFSQIPFQKRLQPK